MNKNYWEPIDDHIRQIAKYYGVGISKSCANSVANELINNIVYNAKASLPKLFYANCADGTVRQGIIPSENIIDIIELRSTVDKEEMKPKDYERILLKTNKIFTYCEDNNKLYSNINPLVGRYIMRHHLSENIVEAVANNSELPRITSGDTAKVYDKYIKMERTIDLKKDIFIDELSKEFTQRDLESNYFSLIYIVKNLEKEHKRDNKFTDLNSKERQYLQLSCTRHNISYFDACTRVGYGMSVNEAIETGIEDPIGFVYELGDCMDVLVDNNTVHMCANNYNFVAYLEYIARQEELELKEE